MSNIITFKSTGKMRPTWVSTVKANRSYNSPNVIKPRFGQSDKSAWTEAVKRYRDYHWRKGKQLKSDKQRSGTTRGQR